MAQPATFTCSRRPGSPSSQGARPLKRSSESRVRNRISPIQMNSGRAVRVHDEEALQIVEIGRAHVRTPVTTAHFVCRPMLDKTKTGAKNTWSVILGLI